jgi:23S rRNA (adenine2503-C2)-methyltransferase
MWDNIKKITSSDENVNKYVYTQDNGVAESVLYKYPTYKDRTVICCSTQSGCPVGCRFCGAGDYFVRSFTGEEIASQSIHLLENEIDCNPNDIDKLQIMFMSMGEPMLNFNELSKALGTLYAMYPTASLLISTSAPIGGIKAFEELNKISKWIQTIGLQFSVHESTDEARKKLIPSPTMTLKQISETGVEWYKACGRKPFFNYCVHDKNDSQEDVDRLVKHFDPSIWQSTISVICERDENIATANERQRKLAQDFSSKMLQAGYNVRVFNPAGQDDIGGGCGQLWYVQDWMNKNKDKIKKTKGHGLEKVHAPKEL